ncbi:hypothetical protein LTR65_010263 [Meristemomyces frigidus]
MSADDDTFEIDIYGDDQPEQEPIKDEPIKDELQQEPAQGYDGTNDAVKPEPQANGNGNGTQHTLKQDPGASTTPAPQGTKRKAPDTETDPSAQDHYTAEEDANYVAQAPADTRPIDPNAQPALKLADLHWWTTEEDVRGLCARAGAEEELHDIAFGEHKINGKSKGEVYLEFASLQAATAVKRAVEAASRVKEESSGVRRAPFTVAFTGVGNPFKTATAAGGSGGGKRDFGGVSGGGRGGAYNSFGNRGGNGGGGGFGGRGNYNNNRGGGGAGYNNTNNGNNNMMQTRPTPQAGWGMNGGMGGNGGMAAANGGMAGNGAMGGYAAGFNNPMMAGAAGFGGMNMGYGNMGRGGGGGGMMNNMGMMGRGGFGGMGGMGGMGMNMGGMMGGVRGGGNGNGNSGMMGGRGGWAGGGAGAGGAGFQQGGYGGGGTGGGYAAGSMSPQGQGQGGNKRAKME